MAGVMKASAWPRPGERLSVLCLGAHSDDIEIGAGGTILEPGSPPACGSTCAGACSQRGGPRAAEAAASAEPSSRVRPNARSSSPRSRTATFPTQSEAIKQWLIDVRSRFTPDVVLTHRRADAHQDHREVNQLTWNVFRDHLILEYEIPKWDGDLGQPNVYVPLDARRS